ncbi:MAG: hypothetical protein GXZ11_01405 [Tissierellia bacterium]|nr:hypothetical protein [Tissierellia bacterium]
MGEGLLALPNYFKADDELTAKDEVKELEVEEVAVDVEAAVDYNELTTGELKKLLEEKGIEYPKNAKKDKLIELLK